MVKRLSQLFLIASFLCMGPEYLFAQSRVLREVEALMLEEAYARAARECERILAGQKRASVKSKAQYLLGLCLLQEGKFAQARVSFNQLLQKYPRSKFCDDAYLGIAHSYYLAGDFPQASIQYNEFLKKFPYSQLVSIAREYAQLCAQDKPRANAYFSVQVGCFNNRANAEKLRDELIDAGLQAYILKLPEDEFYRVRIGRFETRLEAEFLEQRLKTEGYSTKVCP